MRVTKFRNKGENIPTKTADSTRTIYLPTSLIPIINEHISHVLTHISGQLFTSPITGKPISKEVLSIGFKNYLVKNNLPIIRFHDLRHLHATLLVNKGVDIKSISTRLGHSTVDTTLKVYSHSIDEYDKAAAEDFNSVLEQASL